MNLAVLLATCLATTAITLAVVQTELFRSFRNLGHRAYDMPKCAYWLLTPARASHCVTCFGFWAAMPVAIWAAAAADAWAWLPILWLAAAALPALTQLIGKSDDDEELRRLVERYSGTDAPSLPSFGTNGAQHREGVEAQETRTPPY